MRTHTFFFRTAIVMAALLLSLVLSACSVSNRDFVHKDNRPKVGSRSFEGIRYPAPDPDYTDAREIKLKLRELADQLVADMEDCSLQGAVALPTSFVNLDDFNETSAFGRLIAEQLFYELNQRGYPVREYRLSGNIQPRARAGEFALSRELGRLSAKSGHAVMIVGTYAQASNAVFVNARLVRPKDGRVIRTANLVFESNPTLVGMLANTSNKNTGGGKAVTAGSINIRDFDTAMHPPQPQNLTFIDLGEDIH